METALPFIAAFLIGYLLGSIPFGLIFTRVAGTQDIRSIGSGSIGATNVLRTGSKGLAAATLLADVLKGTVAVVLSASWFGHDPALIAGLGAFLGHLFPIWLKFRGGKGVATGLGILLVISWKVALAAAVIWIALAVAFRYSSLASLTTAIAAPLILWYAGMPPEALLFVALAALTFFMHRANIARLLKGTESKIGQKADAPREA